MTNGPPRFGAGMISQVARATTWPVVVLVGMLLSSFLGGIATYQWFLVSFRLDVVAHDTYVLKRDLVGQLSTGEAIREIDHLIEAGMNLGDDEPKTRVWLLQSLAFVHSLDLVKDWDWQGHQVSALEADIRFAQTKPVLAVQAQETLGVLKGMRAGVQVTVGTLNQTFTRESQ